MDDLVQFNPRNYALFLGLLVAARGMDFLSTWIATPRLVLEANPLARRLGWRWAILPWHAATSGHRSCFTQGSQ